MIAVIAQLGERQTGKSSLSLCLKSKPNLAQKCSVD